MKDILVSYASYNVWATKKIVDTILELPAGMIDQELKSSFPSISKTLLHMWDAESAWWQRMKLLEKIVAPSTNDQLTTQDIINGLLGSGVQWQEWVESASDAALEHVFQYQNSKKEIFKQPIWQMLLHVFNHGTYHRGQIVTMMRELGVEKIPGTDYILFSRIKK